MFWSTGRSWGTYSQKKAAAGEFDVSVKVLYGEASGLKVKAGGRFVEL